MHVHYFYGMEYTFTKQNVYPHNIANVIIENHALNDKNYKNKTRDNKTAINIL